MDIDWKWATTVQADETKYVIIVWRVANKNKILTNPFENLDLVIQYTDTTELVVTLRAKSRDQTSKTNIEIENWET